MTLKRIRSLVLNAIVRLGLMNPRNSPDIGHRRADGIRIEHTPDTVQLGGRRDCGEVECGYCQGKGIIDIRLIRTGFLSDPGEFDYLWPVCSMCKGTGKLASEPPHHESDG